VSENLEPRALDLGGAGARRLHVDGVGADIEYVVVDFVEPMSRLGRAATAEAIGRILGEWEEPRIEADEVRPLDDGRVLVFNHLAARGKTSGIDVGDMRHNGAAILSFRDGTVACYLSYFDRDRALADLGLEE
jgi:hypothetical protein